MKGGAPRGGRLKGGSPRGGTLKGGAPRGGTLKGGAPRGGTLKGGAPRGGTLEGGSPRGETLKGGAPRGGTLKGGAQLTGLRKTAAEKDCFETPYRLFFCVHTNKEVQKAMASPSFSAAAQAPHSIAASTRAEVIFVVLQANAGCLADSSSVD